MRLPCPTIKFPRKNTVIFLFCISPPCFQPKYNKFPSSVDIMLNMFYNSIVFVYRQKEGSEHMKKATKAFIMLVCLMLALCSLAVPETKTYALTIGTVHVNDSLRVRSGPGTTYSVLGNLYNGNTVTVTDSTSYAGWYKIDYNGGVGYVSADYVTLSQSGDTEYEPDADFEAYMDSQGFPESYKPYLRQMHAAHPNWIFKAFHTNLEWDDVITNECKLGRSLIQKLSSYPDAYYSYQQGAYNWDTGQFTVFDGTNWIQASQALVEYAVDPRNYINDTYIFAFFGLNYSTSETVDGINSILNGTFMSGAYPDFSEFATYADAFLKAAQQSGVSAYHLASSCRQEQGKNGSQLSRGTVPGYEGYYNFFNIGAYTTSSASNVVNGAIRAKNEGWDTPYKSILGGANFIGNGYIKIGQNTKYLHKFDLIPYGGLYTHQYMTNILAAFSEGSSFKKAFSENVMQSNLAFNIPVFTGMPEYACAKPTGAGDNNYLLGSLSIDGFSLTPEFSTYTQNYELVVDYDVTSVNISGAAMSANASVSGLGTHQLSEGDNIFKITVTAKTGTQCTYTVTVSRREQPESTDDPYIAGTAYTFGTYITGISPETDISDFINNLGVSNGSVSVYVANGNNCTDGRICSGYRVEILRTDGSVFLSYETVIYGDINGDGKISTSDLSMGHRYVLGTYSLAGARLEAADINRDGKVSTADLAMGHRHVLNTYTINQ
jgi:beta-N-acetylglucosaminidase/uncharacterized protein YraI